MIIRDEALHHIATDVNYESNKWGAVCAIVDKDGVKLELRWSRGSKLVNQSNV